MGKLVLGCVECLAQTVVTQDLPQGAPVCVMCLAALMVGLMQRSWLGFSLDHTGSESPRPAMRPTPAPGYTR